jgi:hypothetical protein
MKIFIMMLFTLTLIIANTEIECEHFRTQYNYYIDKNNKEPDNGWDKIAYQYKKYYTECVADKNKIEVYRSRENSTNVIWK